MMKLMKWRKSIIGVALVVACAESVVLWNGRDKYLRYVSAPLEDGARFTLLYPARLSVVEHSEWGSGATAYIGNTSKTRTLSFGQKALLWMGWPKDQTLPDRELLVLVACYRDGGPDSKWKTQSQGQSSLGFVSSNYGCSVDHMRAKEDAATFQREDKVIGDSFQILPPGAPVPSP